MISVIIGDEPTETNLTGIILSITEMPAKPTKFRPGRSYGLLVNKPSGFTKGKIFTPIVTKPYSNTAIGTGYDHGQYSAKK